jgi:hypothetical protein
MQDLNNARQLLVDAHLSFDESGQYKLDTLEQRLAACVAALRAISIVPIAYHGSATAETREAEMARIANGLLNALTRLEP